MSALVHIEGGVGYPAFSGSGDARNNPYQTDQANVGPIPKGRYYIVDRPSGGLLGPIMSILKYDQFALFADDGSIDDFTTVNGAVRSAFRLHGGSVSIGCITVANSSSYQLLRDVLMNTTTANIPGTNTKYYGTVTVR